MGIKMEGLYKISGIRRQVYFNHKKRLEKVSYIEMRTLETARQVRLRHPSIGARPLYYMLQPQMGINKFEKLISDSGLGIGTKSKWIKTTDSNHPYRKYSNLTHGITLNNTDCLWATDITYWQGKDLVYYLTFIMDVYSRRIIGHSACNNMYAVSTLKVLESAFKLRKQSHFQHLIHHSDKGSQYCSTTYTNRLKMANISISMAKTSLENPYAERINGIIKNDYLLHFNTGSYAKLSRSLDEAVWLYNNERPHSELGYMTPLEYETQVKRQKSGERYKMTLYDFNKDK